MSKGVCWAWAEVSPGISQPVSAEHEPGSMVRIEHEDSDNGFIYDMCICKRCGVVYREDDDD